MTVGAPAEIDVVAATEAPAEEIVAVVLAAESPVAVVAVWPEHCWPPLCQELLFQ